MKTIKLNRSLEDFCRWEVVDLEAWELMNMLVDLRLSCDTWKAPEDTDTYFSRFGYLPTSWIDNPEVLVDETEINGEYNWMEENYKLEWKD